MNHYLLITLVCILCILIALVVFILLISNNYIYCSIFERKYRKLWRKFISNSDDFTLFRRDSGAIEFISSDRKYKAIIWGSDYEALYGLCSIHNKEGGGCILSCFDKKLSKTMANKLLNKIENRDI